MPTSSPKKTTPPTKTRKTSVKETAPFRLSVLFTMPVSDQPDRQANHAAFPGAVALAPWRNRGEWSEIADEIAERIDSGSYDPEDLWAVFPSDFHSVTGMTQESVISLITENPGQEIYFFHLLPVDEALFPNPWTRLLLEVPDFAQFLPSLLRVVGEGESQPLQMRGAREFHSFPCLVGRPAFWKRYLDFARDTRESILRQLNTGQKKLAKTQVKSTNRAYGNETYLGLISRNLFPFYLSRYGSESKALKVLLPTRESRLNEHVRTLRHLREASVQSKSAWLAAAWLNYRNLYLLGVNGRAWCDQNLPLISPRVPTTGLTDEAVSKAF